MSLTRSRDPAGRYHCGPNADRSRHLRLASLRFSSCEPTALKVVIPTIMRNVTLRAIGDKPEPIRRRAITFVPAHDAMVRVERFHERAGDVADQAPVAA